ncbi:hypothetical protein [Aureibacillus halotolerans]|uniref:hypothetical protein n=1 Tax=Aureibacillus halotolerans TaxID=1508390 RepID=UPI00105D23A6|nr:hypothetical protein [Aureibacillus halotolerans]
MADRANADISITIEDHHPKSFCIGGMYDETNHHITLYKEGIKEQCTQTFKSLDWFLKYAAVICAHELGHATDPMLQSLVHEYDSTENEHVRKQILHKIECNAWDFAQTILTDIHPQIIRDIRLQSLAMFN